MTKKEKRAYAKNSKKRESIPPHFRSVAEAAEFWDSHDLTDYWDLTREASFEVDIQPRVLLTALEPGLAKKLTECARKQGVSTETLINVWLTGKVAEASRTS
jgi:hypothetical protein